ncbi:glycosyltransferase [Achromobacter sp. ACRQX]|jgi:glycosyltransferase involved in cell wall biosynthesis|uniref:glycosyltransferase family 2 protein n=1 Tax=Achromobacter sp. ACRQX TaxID=2918181 RepID=UPI001EF315B6|nr:glycosyltransferase [Achromobacter sp. ACRQX]MCG7328572.1 glycosyltransferase [Achromobacter sp. ACRQX]
MNAPLVSVIIPVYNQGELAVQAIDSVLSQRYPNVQAIVVDDGSTDGTADLIAGHFGTRVELIRQSNRGPSAASNAALRVAQGEFIALMGGDDLCTPDRLEHQISILSSGEWDIVFSRPDLIDDDGKALADAGYPVFFQPRRHDSVFVNLFFDDNYFCAPSATMRRDVTDTLGGFHEGLIQLQDYDYWLRATGQGFRIGLFDHRVVKYRRHVGNLSAVRRDFAARAEIPFVLKRALRMARPEVIRPLFPGFLQPCSDASVPLSAFEESVLLLAHRREEVRFAGMDKAISLLDKPVPQNAPPMGIDLFRFLYAAGQE